MTNRARLNKKIMSMSDRSLAHYLSYGFGCVECPAKDLCHAKMCEKLSCEQTLEAWFKHEDEDDQQR